MDPFTRQVLLQRLYSTHARFLDSDDEEGDDVDDYMYPSRAPPPEPPQKTEPQEAGVQLLASGEFGRTRAYRPPSKDDDPRLKNLIRRPSVRPMTYGSPNRDLINDMVPNTNGTTVATYNANVYTAQFSDDSSFYYTCAQDFRLHVFDTTAPPTPFEMAHRGSHLKSSMALRKEIRGEPGRWTITDANLSPDNSKIIYSSITPVVYMTSTSPEGSPHQTPIDFQSPTEARSRYGETFGIWSCRFSADGNEVVAGGDGKIFVYDLIADKRILRIEAHSRDVNSCCWADTGSGNVLISASDDSYLKVWDRRSLASKKPSGVLMGHTEGITYVSPKGDGRYIISNGKDQTLRLWDLRMMRSNQHLESMAGKHFGVRGFDYREPRTYRQGLGARKHPLDCSIMTYRGHSVMRTLIRCHFSPIETTGGQYIYSGSADGRIHVWSLDGRVVQILDRSQTLPASFEPSGPEPPELRGPSLVTCVRDVSWHASEPVIMSAAWDLRWGGTTIARHEWKGLSKLNGKLESWLEKQELEQEEVEERARRRGNTRESRVRGSGMTMPGSYSIEEEDDEEWIEEEDDDDEEDDEEYDPLV